MRKSLAAVSMGTAMVLTAGTAAAQSYQNNTTQIPGGAPYNNSFSENVDFGDADLDGDWDAVFADGGEFGNDNNRFWTNLGGAQGGTLGFFMDETHARFPVVQDASRDIEFVDFEADGDLDLFVSNSSAQTNQSNRFWINQGNLQGGSPGFYTDETQTRWVNVGVNDGLTTFSSVAPSLAIVTGGYVDWSCDSSFADLDNDGDMDLVQSTYGFLSNHSVPTRIFLNDGAGFFEEYNPSGFQLSGTDIFDGDPGIWAEGTMQHSTSDASGQFCDIADLAISVDLGDLDGDFDIDIINGDKHGETRAFANMSSENGAFTPFRDVSHAMFPPNWQPGGGAYEQELGDVDQDDDLDLYGVNWGDIIADLFLVNNGDGTYAPPITMANSSERHNEPNYIDYDGDGDLDVLIASDIGQEMMFVNQGAGGGFALQYDITVLPSDSTNSVGLDACDVDQDGDYDSLVANDLGVANAFLLNLTQNADVTPPYMGNLEQVPDRATSSTPTAVRVQVYDNAAWYVTAFNATTVEYSVDGGPFTSAPMTWSGGQIFRGEIPGTLAGTISYRVRSSDAYGNSALSATLDFDATSACNAGIAIYCVAQVNTSGCTPAISTVGFPSASAPGGFHVEATNVLNDVFGILFYSKTGSNNVPFGGGTLCVLPPTQRTPAQLSGGSGLCGGAFSMDFNAWVQSGVDPVLASGSNVWAQYWSRDPAAVGGSNLTDAASFTLCP